MSTVNDLPAARATAGAKYAEAAYALAIAWIDLQALDMLLCDPELVADGQAPERSIGAEPPKVPGHAEFLPAPPLPYQLTLGLRSRLSTLRALRCAADLRSERKSGAPSS